MEKPRFDAEFDDFYNTCLTELKARENYTDAFVPMLERYVTITATLSKLNFEIIDTEIEVDHTNKAGKTNKATSPAWRMFLALNREAQLLAKDLGLTPGTAPKATKKDEKKGFDLKMKIAK